MCVFNVCAWLTTGSVPESVKSDMLEKIKAFIDKSA